MQPDGQLRRARRPVVVAVCGAGYWGKNVIRAFHDTAGVEVRCVCDQDEDALVQTKTRFRDVRTTTALDEIFADQEVDAVAVVTPSETHFDIARRALAVGKDAFVEKPLALSVPDATELVAAAEADRRVLMVGHLLEYHPAVRKLKDLIDAGELGEVLYACCRRVNLGQIKRRENALWSLAPHDVSTLIYLFGEEPFAVSARGESYIQRDVADVVFVTLHFPRRKLGQIHVSWLDPRKARETVVVGSRKMAVFEDTEPVDKLCIYDSGVKGIREPFETYQDFQGLRFGDTIIPRLDNREPLLLEVEHFVECVRTRQQPKTDGRNGLRVVGVLTAAQASLERNGETVRITAERMN